MRNFSLIILISCALSLSLAGCGGKSMSNNTVSTQPTEKSQVDSTMNYVEKKKDENERVIDSDGKVSKREQMNSFSMMYYLAITAEEIRSSKDNRLILEEINTSLLNDINPGAIDERTQEHLMNLRDIIGSYLGIQTKRDRLQYIYNQEKAAAIRNAVPNPLAILSVSNSLDWKKLAITTAYTVVDSYNNYKNASENADKEFLMSGWELDDQEVKNVQKNRDRAFDYMVDMVQEYELDGKLTLNEKSIEKFVDICRIESIPERIKRLESEEETYQLLGDYWLELADCYFETDKYKKVLDCINKYNEISTGIYRQDFNYARVLPKVIVAAQNVYADQENEYVDLSKKYADDILNNTTKDEENWSIRFFAAQVYIDLFERTDDKKYLKNAYDIAYDNATILLQKQRNLNEEYLSDIKEVEADNPEKDPEYKYMSKDEQKKKKREYKEEQKQAKKFNKTLKKERKVELPPLYEPLVVNCELLFGLADIIGISDEEKADIEAVMKTKSNGIFISKPINDAYSFSNNSNRYNIEMKKDEIIIPTYLLTADSEIKIIVTQNGDKEIIDDCRVSKVKREGEGVDSFTTFISSKKMKKKDWTLGSNITVMITYHDAYDKNMKCKFSVSDLKDHWYGDKVVFKAE